VLGAAIGSIVAGVAGSLYTASLKHTKDKITSAFVGRVGNTPVEVATVSDDTVEIDGWDWGTATQPAAAVAPPSAAPVATSAAVDEAGKPASRLPWKPILVSTAAVFLLAIAGITGFELISGQAVSGGEGTTITQVSEARSGGFDSPSQAPSSDASTEPSADSSAQPSSEPSAEPSSTQSAEPTTEPSQTSEPTQTSEPSASSIETPTTAAGDGDVDGAADSGDGTAGG
jgi:cytoskeletal protein RodZ